ncbi:MAG: DUF2859 domain-containing protein [Cocleimonas sp.]
MDNVKRTFFAGIIFVLLSPITSNAEVIGDFGGDPVFGILATIIPQDKKEKIPTPDMRKIEKQFDKMYKFPFKPSSAKAGTHRSVDFKEPLTSFVSPVALVGSDYKSLLWLKSYEKKLLSIGAIVMIVQAKNSNELANTLAAYKGQGLPAYSSDKVFKMYSIKRYPVLITSDGVYQ